MSKNLCSTSYTECLKLIHIENLLHFGTIFGSFYTHSQHHHQPWDLGWADYNYPWFIVKNTGLERERNLLWVISEEGPSGEQHGAQNLNSGLLHSALWLLTSTEDMNPYPLEGQRTMKGKGMLGTNWAQLHIFQWAHFSCWWAWRKVRSSGQGLCWWPSD